MDFRFNDEQRMWNDTVQDSMARKGSQDYRLQHDLSREFSDDVSQKMAKHKRAKGVKKQEITFTASVDRNTFAVGENIKLTLTLTN